MIPTVEPIRVPWIRTYWTQIVFTLGVLGSAAGWAGRVTYHQVVDPRDREIAQLHRQVDALYSIAYKDKESVPYLDELIYAQTH